MELQGKVAPVTGAGSGIGAPTALFFPREEAKVGALSHIVGEVRERVARLKQAGGEAAALIADVTAENGLRNAIGEVARVYGRADIVLASAGINGVWGPIDELEPDEWDRRVNTHLRGAFLTLHFAVPHLERAGGGSEAPAEYPAGEIPLTGDKSGKAEDVAELALFLASDRARHITGSPVWIDGAQSLLVG